MHSMQHNMHIVAKQVLIVSLYCPTPANSELFNIALSPFAIMV